MGEIPEFNVAVYRLDPAEQKKRAHYAYCEYRVNLVFETDIGLVAVSDEASYKSTQQRASDYVWSLYGETPDGEVEVIGDFKDFDTALRVMAKITGAYLSDIHATEKVLYEFLTSDRRLQNLPKSVSRNLAKQIARRFKIEER